MFNDQLLQYWYKTAKIEFKQILCCDILVCAVRLFFFVYVVFVFCFAFSSLIKQEYFKLHSIGWQNVYQVNIFFFFAMWSMMLLHMHVWACVRLCVYVYDLNLFRSFNSIWNIQCKIVYVWNVIVLIGFLILLLAQYVS